MALIERFHIVVVWLTKTISTSKLVLGQGGGKTMIVWVILVDKCLEVNNFEGFGEKEKWHWAHGYQRKVPICFLYVLQRQYQLPSWFLVMVIERLWLFEWFCKTKDCNTITLQVLVRKKSDNGRMLIIERFHLVVVYTTNTISTAKLVLGHGGWKTMIG
jgi:hypothetical protein